LGASGLFRAFLKLSGVPSAERLSAAFTDATGMDVVKTGFVGTVVV
jgi:hypothetical protein